MIACACALRCRRASSTQSRCGLGCVDDPDKFRPVGVAATVSVACTVRSASSIDATSLTRQDGAAVPVQSDERRDTDRQRRLMGAGRPTRAATRW